MSNSKSRVYLNKLTLYNYRTYSSCPEPTVIEFSPDPKKPITIITDKEIKSRFLFFSSFMIYISAMGIGGAFVTFSSEACTPFSQ